jgi:hypothetical protein
LANVEAQCTAQLAQCTARYLVKCCGLFWRINTGTKYLADVANVLAILAIFGNVGNVTAGLSWRHQRRRLARVASWLCGILAIFVSSAASAPARIGFVFNVGLSWFEIFG